MYRVLHPPPPLLHSVSLRPLLNPPPLTHVEVRGDYQEALQVALKAAAIEPTSSTVSSTVSTSLHRASITSPFLRYSRAAIPDNLRDVLSLNLIFSYLDKKRYCIVLYFILLYCIILSRLILYCLVSSRLVCLVDITVHREFSIEHPTKSCTVSCLHCYPWLHQTQMQDRESSLFHIITFNITFVCVTGGDYAKLLAAVLDGWP